MQIGEQHDREPEHRGCQRAQHTGRAQHHFAAACHHIAVQQALVRNAVEDFGNDGGGQQQEHQVALGHAQHPRVDHHHQQRADQQRQHQRAALRRAHERARRPQGGFHADGRAALHPHQHRHAFTRIEQQRGHRHRRRHLSRCERLAVACQDDLGRLPLSGGIQIEPHVFQPGYAERQPAFNKALRGVADVQLQPVHRFRKAPIQPGGRHGLPGSVQDLADVLGRGRVFLPQQFVVQGQLAGHGVQVDDGRCRRYGLCVHGRHHA